MESSEWLSCGSYLGKILHGVVENSLVKGRSNNNSKSLTGYKELFASTITASDLRINTDPSYFSTLAFVRKLIRREQDAAAKKGYNLSKVLTSSNLDFENEEKSIDEIQKNQLTHLVPQVVVISLRSIFDLIEESKSSHPELCFKVLKALLGILQNLSPESLSSEPCQVVEPLFELLLKLSTVIDAENDRIIPAETEEIEGSLSSLASSCLLSLTVAWGLTPKILQALDTLITVARPLAAQLITLPNIMLTLQKGVRSALVGTSHIPDWFSQGIQKKTLVTSFSVNAAEKDVMENSIASDGSYVYLLTSNGLHKIGTGFGSTVSGRIYVTSKKSFTSSEGILLFFDGQLFIHTIKNDRNLHIVDKETLALKSYISLQDAVSTHSVLFSDGKRLGSVFKTDEDELQASLFEINKGELFSFGECRLRLALQSLYVVGASTNDESTDLRQINFPADEGLVSIIAGKEFLLMVSTTGKVSYQGKASSLGLKSGESVRNIEHTSNRWYELPIPKSSSIVRCATGHDGQHAVFLDADGVAFFTGLAKRGEDGDLTKHRRQQKSSRPKRFTSVEGKSVIDIACNNGSSAMVTKDGELYLFGKDSTYCDSATGRLAGIKERIVKVALGKAHGVILTDKGGVYTFGINNKGQCGRDLSSSSLPQFKQFGNNVSLQAAALLAGCKEPLDDEVESEDSGSAIETKLCAPEEHRWSVDQCMICTQCGQCTGFGSTCVNTNSPGRLPGTFCGCGSGEAGCTVCGVCRTCARIPNNDAIGLPPAPVPILSLACGRASPMAGNNALLMGRFVRAPLEAYPNAALVDVANFHAPRIDGRGNDDPKMRDAIIGDIALNADAALDGNRRHRHHRRRHPSEIKVAVTNREASRGLEAKKIPASQIQKNGTDGVLGSDGDRDANKLASLSPGPIGLPSKVRISQVACGLHHSVLLTTDGQVYTFGSNSYGQLGVGDLSSRGSPTLVKIPSGINVSMIAAGSYHTAVLTSDGDVLTWGAHLKGQLAREASDSNQCSASPIIWHSVPGFVTRIGPKCGKRASWIGASGDQTFFKLEESLISETEFHHSTVLASDHYFAILPTHSKSSSRNLVISRNDGQCRSFSGQEQVNFANTILTWDPVYNMLWSFCKSTSVMRGYNVFASGLTHPSYGESLFPVLNEREPVHVADIFRPALSLPVVCSTKITQTQAALHLLCCLDTLTRCQQIPVKEVANQDTQKTLVNRCYTKEDFSVVNRFESHGGGWGYSGHSVEAIRFMSDTDILLGGFSLFGGRGEYMGKIKVFDLGTAGGDQEGDGELLAETDEVVYECGARQRFPILFSQPIRLQANRWYLAWARVNGPSSDCGSGGQSSVTTEDQVTFTFKPSKKSNNGTDVNAGQVPQILFRIITHDAPSSKTHTHIELVHSISNSFSKLVTPDCFTALLSLTRWAWSALKAITTIGLSGPEANNKGDHAHIEDLSRIVFVCRASMRLIRFYILELYPVKSKHSKKLLEENVSVVKAIASVRTTLRSILSDPVLDLINKADSTYLFMLEQIVKETHDSFVACFHVFYPTATLKWSILCELLDQIQKVANATSGSDRLLAAVVDSLCSHNIQLKSALPNLCDLQESLHVRRAYQSPEMEGAPCLSSPSENGSTSTTQLPVNSNQFPVLVEHMVEGQAVVHRPCRAVLDRLFLIASWPVRQSLDMEPAVWSDKLVQYSCRLLARVVAELASQVCSVEELDVSSTRGVHATPSRFTSTSQNRSWNTGNGSPDAICFTVDRPNVSVCGVGVFGGGGTYTYELELLELIRSASDAAQTLSWHSLAVIRGTYGPEDCINDVADIKFDRPIPIKENTRYTLRLRNQGGKTHNGDGGVLSTKGPDGTTFNFSACLLSFNGTNHIRGQLPYILYCNMPNNSEVQLPTLSAIGSQARKSLMSIASSIVRCTADLLCAARALPIHHSLPVICKSHVVSYLLPFVVANIGVVAESDPKNAVQILELIRVLLPHVSALCLADILSSQKGENAPDEDPCITTSPRIVVVESEHPYRPATVSHFRVCFPESVRWMCLEFDSQCCTSQVEDSLQLHLPTTLPKSHANVSLADYWPLLKKFGGTDNWPSHSMILPGNEVIFSLETASDCIRNDKASSWGFRCSVVGYESLETNNAIRLLETELAYLGGMCSATLMKRDLALPQSRGEDMDVESMEYVTQQIYAAHSGLLGKGLALSQLPTIYEALEGNLPFSVTGKERQFLRDFVSVSQETSGGRLARWLQPEAVVDPSKSQLIFPGVFSASLATFGVSSSATLGIVGFKSPVKTIDKDEEDEESTSEISAVAPTTTTVVSEGLRAGWPAILTLLTRDQYGHLVHVPNLKVNIRAVPCDLNQASKDNSLSPTKRLNPGDRKVSGEELEPPVLDVSYDVTTKDRMCLHAITFLKAYENYSFEELRFVSPIKRRTSETMLVRPNADGSYSANWTPSAAGLYSIHVTIDDYPLEDVYKVDVKEPPQGVLPPTHNITVRNNSSSSHRVRQFRTRASAGLRIRAQPSLQGEQIGIVACNGTVSFIEELCNDDGTWLRLSTESIREWCINHHSEAWCLQYNQHIGKTLLFPINTTQNGTNETGEDLSPHQKPNKLESNKKEEIVYSTAQTFYVVDCGASGHNIRAQPSLKALPVGKLKLGSSVLVTEQRPTAEGTWIKLLPSSARQYCSNNDLEAWSLAIDRHQIVYLRHEGEVLSAGSDKYSPTRLLKPAYDFSESADKQANLSAFSSPEPVSTFIFGIDKDPDFPRTTLPVSPPKNETGPTPKDNAPEPAATALSVQKSSLESSIEDVGALSGSCGPFAAVAVGRLSAFQNWLRRDGSAVKEAPSPPPRSRDLPPELQGVSVKDMVRVMGESRANGNSSPTSSPILSRKTGAVAVVNRSLSAHSSPGGSRPSGSAICSETAQRSRSLSPATQMPLSTDQIADAVLAKKVTQTGTQTSPEASKTNHFNMCADLVSDLPHSPQRMSPKALRAKERSSRGGTRSRKSRSPATGQHITGRSLMLEQENARVGMSPSTAECLRAVFAANLWHQGLVHDAMVCASFLKFHPNLPKQVDPIMPLGAETGQRKTREEKARQRHSVEIFSTNILAGSFASPLPVALEESWNTDRVESTTSQPVEPDMSESKMAASLTPTLSLLVELWEKMSARCMELIQSEPAALSSVPCLPLSQTESVVKCKPKTESRDARDKERKRKSRRESIRNPESNCELCGGLFSVPVTAHMRQAHPGCQKPALGLGYNPDGQYCGGWVGNCGEGGIQGSSWYLLCEDCRHRYLQQRKQVGEAFGLKDDKGKRLRRKISSVSTPTPASQLQRPSTPSETHVILRDNAFFLLQLATSSNPEKNQHILERRRRSLMHQPLLSSVSESDKDLPHRKISALPSKTGYQASGDVLPWLQFQCLPVLKSGCSPQLSTSENNFGDGEIEMDPFRGLKEVSDGFGRQLHRSVSMITQPLAQHLRTSQDMDGPISGVSQRRRTSSADEQGINGGLTLLRSPSKALQDTVKLMSASPSQTSTEATLPVLDFVAQRHDLDSLRTSMELALRKASCRVFAMENLSWLLQNVTQPMCLHDLLWWFVSSLAPPLTSEGGNNKGETVGADGATNRDNLVGQHPTSDVRLAGEGLSPLLQSFHSVLQTVSNLMQLLPMGTPLLAMAVRCWDIRFKQTDHAFLHKSHVFSNISRILSRCEEEVTVDIEALENSAVHSPGHVTMLTEVTEGVDIKVSSRTAMVNSLTDGSTETFWESGDEDRGKMKLITIQICSEANGFPPRIVCVYIDNCRDMGNKVSGVTFKAGPNTEELQIVDVLEVETRFSGWIQSSLPCTNFQVIQLEFKGPDNSLRVRQLRLLGGGITRSFNASAIHQRTCETETLRVFRLLTSQVFGRLILNERDESTSRSTELLPNEDEVDGEMVERTRDIDLKEHMVGILFSGKKLTHLQRQVCTHILHGIQRETVRLKDEWEALLQLDQNDISGIDATSQEASYMNSRVSDSYCFELLSQVLALSGSRVGRTYISQHSTLPANLLSLLHTGSPRIQRQVTALLRRMLPELPPPVFASLVDVDVLPTTDYGILQILSSSGSLERVGILDVFLACIAKALTVQVKTKGRDKDCSKNPISSVTMASIFNNQQQPHGQLGSRWWMRGHMPRRVAESIIQLVRDMALGNLSEVWSAVTKAGIAEAVLSLTKLEEDCRTPPDCLRTPSVWLTLAALCLLQDEHVERLSSTQWARGAVNKPQCNNHDDGETGAQIVCCDCGPLCVDCDRVLHLSRKFRSHQRQVCKEEEEAIKVDVHEGCGRVKLFWILALSDARNLKSLVEFRHGVTTAVSSVYMAANTNQSGNYPCSLVGGIVASSSCRYCGSAISPSSSSLFDDQTINVCNEPDCMEYSRNACLKTHSCGHPCGGVRDETQCLPCLYRCAGNAANLKQDADDMCMICFTEALSAAPAIQLTCKHVFHAHCCRSVLSKKWPGPRITFSFSRCPICKAELGNEFLDDLLLPIRELFDDVKRKALMRLEYEGLLQTEAISMPGNRFFRDAEGYAMERYAYYVCFRCNKAYYGGEARCEEGLAVEGGAIGGESFNPSELVCGGCSDVSRAQMCPRHGADYLEYKCRYCCSVAVFFCFGTTHFCNACHEDFRHVTEMPKHALPKCPAGPRGRQLDGEECPLHLVHPPTGEEFALGCGMCRNAHTF
ncbi:hypothetical protein OUZ56_031000 [Daphnia magna]|uniref:RCR-type E3 ubiquitin transferase n=1 Tax=Daphnia magna TaxID=35525 RepID=A0ABQ9ZSY7_9CRUS|nr:hypothetical protein OUZ56_031000 [Daphnia magna]